MREERERILWWYEKPEENVLLQKPPELKISCLKHRLHNKNHSATEGKLPHEFLFRTVQESPKISQPIATTLDCLPEMKIRTYY